MRGPAWLLAAIFAWAVLDANSKLLASGYAAVQVLSIRYMVLLALFGGLRALRPSAGGSLVTRHPLLQGVRAAAMLGSAFGFFLALRELSMAEAYLVHFTAPFMLLAMAALLLGEAMPGRAWGWTALGFAGVALAMVPGIEAGGALAGYAWALFGTINYAVIMTVNRRLRGEQSVAGVILWPSLLGLAATLPLLPGTWVTPSPLDAALLMGNGLVSGVAMVAMSLAFRHGDAARLAPLEYTALVFALAFDLAIWGVLPAWHVLLGAAVVVLACTGSERSRRQAALPRP